MRHEILMLNQNRSFVLVNDTWYDTHIDLNPRVGQAFLNGHVEKVLDYESYKNTYPDSKKEMYTAAAEKTAHGGFIRRELEGNVRYAVNVGALIPTGQYRREVEEE